MTSTEAADGGHLDVLKYAHEKGCPFTKYTCHAAAKKGHLKVLKYACEKCHDLDFEDLCGKAVDAGHKVIIEYLREVFFDYFKVDNYLPLPLPEDD